MYCAVASKIKKGLIVFINSENGLVIWKKIIEEYFGEAGKEIVKQIRMIRREQYRSSLRLCITTTCFTLTLRIHNNPNNPKAQLPFRSGVSERVYVVQILHQVFYAKKLHLLIYIAVTNNIVHPVTQFFHLW